MNLVGCKWLNNVRFVCPVGKAEPTCESIVFKADDKCRQYKQQREKMRAGVDDKGIPEDGRFQLNLQELREEFR